MRQMMTVGQAADASGLTRKAVRLYEQRGLLAPVERNRAGYRQFSGADVARLVFIRQARRLGLPLHDIAAILCAATGDQRPCATVANLLRRRITDIDHTIEELTRLRASLTAALDHSPSDQADICPIIETAH